MFDREYGLCKSKEVYGYFIRMESKRLEGSGNAGEEYGRCPRKRLQEKMSNMV